jgi:serine/threonine protein kinase
MLSLPASRRPPLSAPLLTRFAADMAKSVNHLHRSGAVHRDIAVRNFLLSSTDVDSARVLLSDFGLARSVGAGDHDSCYTVQFFSFSILNQQNQDS